MQRSVLVSLCTAAFVNVAACGGEFRFDERGVKDAGSQLGPQACVVDGDCRLGTLRCFNAYECVECTQNADCAGRPGGAICRPDTHRCVGCVRNSDCAPGSKCEETSRQCIESCTEVGPACKTKGTRCDDLLCRACERNADCAGGKLCNRPSGQCVACLDDGQCAGATPKCALNYGICVECLRARDCKTPSNVCDPDSNTCK
jgi:hypothetical protein